MATRQANPVLRHIRELAGEGNLTRLTDRQLLDRFTAHADHAAFEALVRRHGPMVLRVCRYVLRDEHAADDAFQATFLVLARKAASLQRQELLASWLYGVAHRVAARARVEAAKRLSREAHAAVRTAPEPAVELSTREVCAALDEELGRLPERYRTPFYLCHVEGRTRDQAARQLGCSVRTLQRLLERGLGLLQARLSGRGVSLSAALLALTLTHGQAPAALPAALLESTRTVARAAATGVAVPVAVAALAKGALRRMAATRGKLLAVLALVAATAGAALMARPAPQRPGHSAKALDAGARPQPATDQHGDALPPGARLRLGSLRLRAGAPVFALLFTPDGKGFFSGAFTGTARLWETASGKELRRFDVPPLPGASGANYLSSLALSRDGRTLAGGTTAGSVYLWEAATGRRLRTLSGGRERVQAVAFAPDGKLLASAASLSGQPGAVILWDTATGKEVRRLQGHAKEVAVLAFAPGGKILASAGEDQSVRLWDVATGRPLRILLGHKDYVGSVAFSPDGKSLASAGYEGVVRLWEVATGEERPRPAQTVRPYRAVAFSPDGKTLASGGMGVFLGLKAGNEEFDANTMRLWDVATGKLRFEFGDPHEYVHALAFTPDGKTLISGGDARGEKDPAYLRLWETATGKERGRLAGHRDRVWALAVSPDGRTLASGSGDRTARLWDLRTRKEIRRLGGHRGWVTAVAFGPDGRTLVTGSWDTTALVWDVADLVGRRLLPKIDREPHGR